MLSMLLFCMVMVHRAFVLHYTVVICCSVLHCMVACYVACYFYIILLKSRNYELEAVCSLTIALKTSCGCMRRLESKAANWDVERGLVKMSAS